MKILIFGTGYLGSRMAGVWSDAVTTDAQIDDRAAVLRALDEHKPDAVVNAAGVTGRPNVDWCETHQAETYRANTIGPLVLAEVCQEKNVYFLHLGSGCIFYGDSPDPQGWREEDIANPIAYYSRTKYAADLLLSRLPNTAIARLRLPIDHIPSPRNLIDKLANYKHVIDVTNSVSIMEDTLSALHQMIEKRVTGIFHVTNPGVLRYRDLMELYREQVDPTYTTEWIQDSELETRGLANRRSTVVIQSTRLAEYGIQMRPIDEAVRDTIKKYATLKNPPPPVPSPSEPVRPTVNNFQFLRQRTREMKGIIAAGGMGTRLAPLTNVTNKHLLPIANRQMVLYPLQTLLDAGIRQIMIVTGPNFAGHFIDLLGSGADRGCRITYRIQDEAGGIAQAVGMAEDFVDGNNSTVILGDNLFDENFLPHITSFTSGAMAFYKAVDDVKRFGVIELDQWNNVISIEEKPENPKSNLAQVGLYVYEPSVFDVIRNLKPSHRGELEITDVNNHFLAQGKLTARPVRGFWSDAGTFPSLRRASEYFAKKEGIQ